MSRSTAGLRTAIRGSGDSTDGRRARRTSAGSRDGPVSGSARKPRENGKASVTDRGRGRRDLRACDSRVARGDVAIAPARPVLAVGRIRDLVAPDSAAVSSVLSEMLATSLSRLTDLPVVANSRMLELTSPSADTSRTALTDAARRAGATEIIEGELIPLPDRQLRLQIRRVDMARGLVRRGYRISGSDRVALFDSVTALVAADFRMDAPSGSLAEVTTRSPIAYRFYEEGLRAFYLSDLSAARRLFQSAIREDSTFAMATYYAWRVALGNEDPSTSSLATRAVALASHSSPRDRLLILTHVGSARADRRAIATAETLATKYGRDPEALLVAAGVIEDPVRAVELLNRAVALDSAANRASASFVSPLRRAQSIDGALRVGGFRGGGSANASTLARIPSERSDALVYGSRLADRARPARRGRGRDAALRGARWDAWERSFGCSRSKPPSR